MHDSKEIENIQGLFVLTVSYVDITTTRLKSINILLKGHRLFICCLYYLSVHCHFKCFYKQYHGDVTEITSRLV